MDAGFWFFGDSFVAAYTIMPVFMSTLTDSPILIGLIPALEGAGWFLPQLFLAKHLEGKKRRLPITLKLGLLDRLPFLFLAIGTFFILKVDPKVAIILFLVVYVIKTFSSGLAALPWQELIATVIPVSHRGRYWGFALTSGKLMGMIGAIIAGFMLANIAYPLNYAYMFLVGFICASISYLFLSMNKEPEINRQPSTKNGNIWGRIKEVLGEDKNFRIYLINRAFVFSSFMGMAFITVYGLEKFNLPISYSAIFTGVMLASEVVGYGIWGVIGDKDGYKRVIEYSNLFLIVGLFALLFVESVWGLYIVFGIISFAHSGELIADQNIAMEFSSETDRPTYIGMSKTLTGPFLLIAPVLGGVLVQLWGYPTMFMTALIISMVAFVVIKFFVVEPRLAK
ncbi:MAG: MFS transporter [Anaerolineae bacterium]|jgi:MFS family permease|nr:MFS transporter [Anaerolineae bacterium]MBT3712487.1 MFS transporter [Anaerolineae bacterium]MBT4309764.1 MFS transporter [Anaerolineae bacterium]MBT4457985.1 MFS transporter [Anaerolineae bacterium]MBT6061746.1 MFS transporter [Anaerolineae bacterium]